MRKSYVTGLATGAVAALIAGGLVAGLPALADNETAKPSPTASDDRRDGPGKGPRHGPGGGPGGGFDALHGEFTVKDKDGKYVVRDMQRGTVTAVSATSVTVKSEDGTLWTWVVNADTKIGRDEKIASIKTGDMVRVQGARDGQTRTAAFIGEPPADGHGRPPRERPKE